MPVCPGCQYAEWHPLCESLVDFDGERLDLHKIPREEIVWSRVSRCEYLDLTVSWIGDEDEPDSWTCPDCGGTAFIGVHRDYQCSGLKGALFVTEVDESYGEKPPVLESKVRAAAVVEFAALPTACDFGGSGEGAGDEDEPACCAPVRATDRRLRPVFSGCRSPRRREGRTSQVAYGRGGQLVSRA